MSKTKEIRTVVKVEGHFKRVNILEDGTIEIISVLEEKATVRQTEKQKKEK